jgi:histidinol-phosphate/aromatic aminotransferase/cobyric acid decarboxylase-like protein
VQNPVTTDGAARAAEARGVAPSAEVAVAWPGWGPLPRLVDEARATPVPVALTAGGAPDPDALLAAAGPATRAVVLCTPNDPTGAAVPGGALRRLAERLAERVWLVVDAALAEFAPDDPGGLAGLLAARERVVVVRSFSKAHAMAGFRAGFAVTGDPVLRERLAPFAGVAAPAQAAMLWATEHGAAVVARRRAVAARERARLRAALAGTGLAFPDGHGPLVWLSASDHDGRALASHLARRRIFVTPGAAWGEDRHVRVVLRGPEATDRLAAALREL